MNGLICPHMKLYGLRQLNLKTKALDSAFFSIIKEFKKIQKKVDLLCLFLYTIEATAWTCEVAGTLKPVVMEQ
jgi:hypothetical protein